MFWTIFFRPRSKRVSRNHTRLMKEPIEIPFAFELCSVSIWLIERASAIAGVIMYAVIRPPTSTRLDIDGIDGIDSMVIAIECNTNMNERDLIDNLRWAVGAVLLEKRKRFLDYKQVMNHQHIALCPIITGFSANAATQIFAHTPCSDVRPLWSQFIADIKH